MGDLRVEDRGAPQYWCVVHVPSGVVALRMLNSRRAATIAKARLEALPIDWNSYRKERRDPRFTGDGSGAAHLLDRESIRLLAAEQYRISTSDPAVGPGQGGEEG